MEVVICLLFFIFTFTDSNGCGNNFNTQSYSIGQCFLCGCEDESLFKIRCKENEVIQMEPDEYLMKEGDSDSNNCTIDNSTKCEASDSLSILKLQDRIEVYKNCTFQNSCEVNIKDRIKTGKKRLVNYPFYCRPKSSIIDMSSNLESSPSLQPIYFSGEKYVGLKIDCDFSVFSSRSLVLDIFSIHLKSSTCSKVKFFSGNEQLVGCSTDDTTLLHTTRHIGTDFKLEIRGMEPDVDDMLFFEIRVTELDIIFVNGGDCRNSTDEGLSTDSTTTDRPATKPPTTESSTIDPTTTYLSTTIPLVTPDSDSSTIDPITASQPTLDGSTQAASATLPTTRPLATSGPDYSTVNPTTSELSTKDSPAPTVSTDPNDNIVIVIMGGILAAVIIIVIVGITLYCFIRSRRKQQKSRNALANSSEINEESHYDYIDIRSMRCTDRKGSNMVQNGDQGNPPDVICIERTPNITDSINEIHNQYLSLDDDDSGIGSTSDTTTIEGDATYLTPSTCDTANIEYVNTCPTPCSPRIHGTTNIEDAYTCPTPCSPSTHGTANIAGADIYLTPCSTRAYDTANIEDIDAYNRNVSMEVHDASN